MEKVASTYGAHANTWKASAHFRRHLLVEKKCFSTVLLDVSLCFFPIGAAHVDGGEAVYRRWGFVFFFFFLSTLEDYKLVLFIIDISTLVFILLIYDCCFLVLLWMFYLFKISSFNPNLSYAILFFQFNPYSFDFFYFFPWSFCKNFIGFQFHHSIQTYDILYFSIWSSFFWFFYPFVQVSFLFSFTLRLEIYSFPMIYFLFWFLSLFF